MTARYTSLRRSGLDNMKTEKGGAKFGIPKRVAVSKTQLSTLEENAFTTRRSSRIALKRTAFDVMAFRETEQKIPIRRNRFITKRSTQKAARVGFCSVQRSKKPRSVHFAQNRDRPTRGRPRKRSTFTTLYGTTFERESSSDLSGDSSFSDDNSDVMIHKSKISRKKPLRRKVYSNVEDSNEFVNKRRSKRGRPIGSKNGTRQVSTSRRKTSASSLEDEDMLTCLLDQDDSNLGTPQQFNWDIEKAGIFMNQWILLEKISVMQHSSPVYRVLNKHGVYGDLRCYSKSEMPKMNMEILCLDKLERYNKSSMVRKICDFQIINSSKEGFMSYLITYHRPSIMLTDIIKADGVLDSRSGTRLALEIFEIVENLAKAKLLMTDIHTDFFSIDQSSGRLFLSDATKVEYLILSLNIALQLLNGKEIRFTLRLHSMKIQVCRPSCITALGVPINEGGLVESTFYMYLDFIGLLPWKDTTDKDMIVTKKRWHKASLNELLSDQIPQPLATCWLNIRRGQMLDVCREHTMRNGTVLIHKYRHHGLRKKIVPTGAMMDYAIIYESLRIFAGNGDSSVTLPLPISCLQEPADTKRASIINLLMRMKREKTGLLNEIRMLQKKIKNWQNHEKQLEAEVARNERFIQMYVYEGEKCENTEQSSEDPASFTAEDNCSQK